MNPRRPRIAITPEALRTLRILAALENSEPSDYLSSLVVREGARIPRSLGDAGPSRSPEESEPPRIPPEPQKPIEKSSDGQISHSARMPPINQVPGLREQILELASQGKGTTEIGRAVGRSAQTISTWLKRERDINNKI